MHIAPIAWSRIAHALPAVQAETLAQLAMTATTYGATLYLVGGAARSVFSQQPITDLDVAISHISSEIIEALAQAVGGRAMQYDQFATATIVMPRNAGMPNIDVVPTRHETYAHPGALPRVAPADIVTDLARRDISVNAIAIAVVPEGLCPVYDPFDGIGDLQRRVARLLHPASCVDDPTRIIRVARLATRLGLRVTQTSLAAIKRGRDSGALTQVSQHRWMHELRKTMSEPNPSAPLARIHQWGVLSAIHPALRYTRVLALHLTRVPHDMRLALLLWHARRRDLVAFVQTWHEAPPVFRQLPALVHTVMAYRRRPSTTPSDIAQRLRAYDAALCATIASVEPTLAQMLAYWHTAQRTTPALVVSGADLVNAGLTPGPHIGQRLGLLRDALLDGHTIAHTHAEQLAWMLAHPPASQLHRQLL